MGCDHERPVAKVNPVLSLSTSSLPERNAIVRHILQCTLERAKSTIHDNTVLDPPSVHDSRNSLQNIRNKKRGQIGD